MLVLKGFFAPKGCGGQGGIRTHGRLPPTAVFKTAALNHSATCPEQAAISARHRLNQTAIALTRLQNNSVTLIDHSGAPLGWNGMRMDQHIDRFWRIVRLHGLFVLAALSLAACATPKYDVGRPMIGARNVAPRAGDMVGPNGKPLRGTEKPYQINGVWYYPKEDRHYNVVGIGSWYGEQFHNRRTANGEIFDMDIPSAAHKTVPLPGLVEGTNLDNGR